jgi:hypothetical protein
MLLDLNLYDICIWWWLSFEYELTICVMGICLITTFYILNWWRMHSFAVGFKYVQLFQHIWMPNFFQWLFEDSNWFWIERWLINELDGWIDWTSIRLWLNLMVIRWWAVLFWEEVLYNSWLPVGFFAAKLCSPVGYGW